MYVNPRFRELTNGREPPSAATPTADDRVAPVDTGIKLVTLDRQSRDGPQSELRVTLAEYQGHKFLSLRIWNHNTQSDVWYPDKNRGLSVRLRECEAVCEALRRGLRIAEGDADPTTPRKPSRRDLPGQGRLPVDRAAGGPEFSEF